MQNNDRNIVIPKTTGKYLDMIAKYDVEFSESCIKHIYSNFNPNNSDFWFNVGVWLKFTLKACKFRDKMSDLGYTLELSTKEFDKYPNCTLIKNGLTLILRKQIESDGPVLKTKFKQLIYTDDYGRTITSEWDKHVKTYYAERIFDIVREYKDMASDFCDKEWIYNLEYYDVAWEEIVSVLNSTKYEIDGCHIDTYCPNMNPYDFEIFCAQILMENNWLSHVTKGSGDQGVDVIASKDKIKIAIQCKHYNSNVGNKAVQEVYAGAAYYDCDAAIVVSNAEFTLSAKQLADSLDIYICHHSNLAAIADSIYNSLK